MSCGNGAEDTDPREAEVEMIVPSINEMLRSEEEMAPQGLQVPPGKSTRTLPSTVNEGRRRGSWV